MKNFELFLELTRLKKPIGFMLLFWPCLWGLTLAHQFSNDSYIFLKHCFLFFCGAVLMRSAGCIVNDILDRKIDVMVERTKNRPIASGKISVKKSLVYVFLLCAIAFLILIQFNLNTIILGLASMPFAFSYPLMKRFTYWPQLFLGITFNYGLVMAWVSLTDEFSFYPLILYFGAIFWTLGYDTIYGFQDIKDDEIIGVKSTSIKFKKNPKLFIELSQDEDIKLRNLANRAVEQGIIALTEDNTVFKFANGKKIMTVPFDQHPYGALAQYFKTDDGVDLMKSLTKKLT